MMASLDEEHINIVLRTQHVARLGCCLDQQPYVVPITYVYEDGYVYGHTNEGKKTQMLRQNPRICLEVDQITAMSHWTSVVALGTFEELSGAEAARALDLLFARLSPTAVSASLAETVSDTVSHDIRLKAVTGVTYRLRLTEKSGRYERPSALSPTDATNC